MNYYNFKDIVYYGLCPFFIHFGIFWLSSGYFAYKDYYHSKKGDIEKVKIQGKEIMKHGGIDWSKYQQTAITSFKNQIFLSLPLMVIISPINKNLDYDDWVWWHIIIKILIALGLTDVIFYIVHRTLHHPSLYSRFHKIHHEWKAPVACRALYAHPLEHVLGNMTPLIVSAYIVGLPYLWLLIWNVIITTNAIGSHSGYRSQIYLFDAETHDTHHKDFNYNFGINIFMDRLLGTYRAE